MLGNDIIDLNQAKIESNWNRSGYLDKIYTEAEKDLIFSARHPDQMVWLLWSMKEAAYKIVNRNLGLRFYAPQSFACALQRLQDDHATGTVQFNEELFFTQSSISDTRIHTIALVDETQFDSLKIHLLPHHKNYLSNFNNDNGIYQLEKTTEGLPYLLRKSDGITQPASISHHGEHLAIVHLPTPS